MLLAAKQDDGATLRDHLESIERQTGRTPEQLQPVDCPEAVRYLWEYFRSMNIRRASSGFGSIMHEGAGRRNPISHGEMESWARRNRFTLEPFEEQALDALEMMYLQHQPKGQ